MAVGSRLLPQRIDIDKYPALNTPDTARYIKNLVYDITDTSTATDSQGSATGVYKPLQSVVKYIDDLVLPDEPEDNFPIGHYDCKETREVYVFIHNTNGNHSIYKLNGSNATYDIIYQGPELDFQLLPEYFIHQGGAYLEIIYLTNPQTGEKVRRSLLMFTDGFGDQRQICVEDAVATNGYDPVLFTHFAGNYDRKVLINMGVPTPSDCIEITEVSNTDPTENNALLFQTWQWRIRDIDVWGRPSEWGIISDTYIPFGNDCISTASGLPRCVDLTFNKRAPHINQVEIAYRNCNSTQWQLTDTLNLYTGSAIGEWWLRSANPEVNVSGDKIIYRFCADKKCQPIAPSETNRVSNPQPRTSQALAKIDNFLGLFNNKDGFLPFSDELKSKIKITVDTSASSQTNNFVNIAVYVAIYNPAININQPIFRQGITDPSNLRYGFGAFNTDNQYRAFFAYEQYFPAEDQKGFIGYFAGTNISTISKQYFLRNTGELIEVEDFSQQTLKELYYSKTSGPFPVYSSKPNGVFLQKFEFNNVPKGRYVFRIASHRFEAAPGLDFRKTSTYTAGLYPLIGTNYSSPINFAVQSRLSESKEIVIDACETSYDGLNDNKILVVLDLCYTHSDIEQGYIYNTNQTDQAQYGVELLEYHGGDVDKKSDFTDHNGFYFTSSTTKKIPNRIVGYCNCRKIQLFSFETGNEDKAHGIFYRYLNSDQNPSFSKCVTWNIETCNQVKIKGKVKLCGTDIGVPNVSVVLTRGRTATTDANGEYTLLASDYVEAANRQDKLYFATNGCAFEGCEDACIDPIDIIIYKCISCEERIITVEDVFVKFKTSKGLLSGATYPVGVVGWDWLGRATYVQPLRDLTIPSVQQTRVFTPSVISVQVDTDAVFPSGIEYITFWVGEPNGILEYITWIVDKAEFIDNSGVVNESAPTQIKIYYESLIEYNKQNNYNTTVNWSFIDSVTNSPVISDKVIFLLNGDGNFFEKSITALIKYDQEGQYFLINYTNDLKDLKENAIIRIVRPKVCETTDLYFELCSTIPIENGKATVNTFLLNAFDTYYVNRQIPVPVQVGDDDVQVQLRVFGVPFEHNSPSDFWGEKCKNAGRVNIENPQETEMYRQDQVALSGALSETGQLNFLNYFDSAKKTNFSDTYINGIVSVLPYPGILLIIGQSDNFIVGFNDNLMRINADGTAQAASIANAFGKPQTKITGNYGCLLFDKNTISRYENTVQWLDSSRSTVVQHNYQQAIQVTKADPAIGVVGGVDSWIRPKIKAVQAYNLINGNKRYFHGIINPVNQEYILSDFIIGSNNYVNSERGMNVFVPETISFNTVTKLWRMWYGFVPAMYAQLQGEVSAQQLFSFVNGIPYKHYSVSGQGYGMIYGGQANRVFEVVAVMDGMNKKKFNSISQYCKQSQYFCDRARTENDQETRILLENWLQAEYGWYAPFFCDLNTPFSENLPKQTGELKIMEGNVMYGNFIIIRMVGNPIEDVKYSELQGVIVYASPNSIS